MSSVIDQVPLRKPPSRRLADTFEIWNRKLHYYLGLYFLFFLWLFAFSGLLLNHSSWKFAEFFPNRKVSKVERSIQPPPAASDMEQAGDLMRQLGIHGEIEWTTQRSDPARLDFRATKPGHIAEIKADFRQGRATIETIDYNVWGLMRTLHTFTGVRRNDARNQRDWILTTVWALSMDALAGGVILMVFSSFYMWWVLKPKRALGLAALGLGIIVCGLFVSGLRWIYP
jgi:hypothetical protein